MEPEEPLHRLAGSDLTEVGVEEAREAGRKLKEIGLKFDLGFTSELSRAQKTLDIILDELGQSEHSDHAGTSRSTSAITATSRA